MVENGKRKSSTPTSLATTTNQQKNGQTTTPTSMTDKNNGHNDIKRLKRSSDVEKDTDSYESLYNDPITKEMGAHEKFVFNLGLDLALECALESFDSMIKEKQEEMNLCNETKSSLDVAIVNSLPFNIENKCEFFNDLNKKRSIIRKRTRTFHWPQRECILCNFKTESNLVMDSHLSEPHNMSTLR